MIIPPMAAWSAKSVDSTSLPGGIHWGIIGWISSAGAPGAPAMLAAAISSVPAKPGFFVADTRVHEEYAEYGNCEDRKDLQPIPARYHASLPAARMASSEKIFSRTRIPGFELNDIFEDESEDNSLDNCDRDLRDSENPEEQNKRGS